MTGVLPWGSMSDYQEMSGYHKGATVTFRAFPLLLVCLLVPVGTFGDELARLRYATALQIASLDQSKLDGVNDQIVQLSTQSKLPGVSPQDIRIWIDTGKQTYDIPITENGHFALPVSDELKELNPWIYANQPQGSMVIWGHFCIEGSAEIEAVRVRDELRIPYHKLFPMHAMTSAMKRLAEELGEEHVVHTRNLNFVGVVLSPTHQATRHGTRAILVHEGRRRTLTIRPDGSFDVPYDPQLMRDDAYLLVESPGKWTFRPVAPSTPDHATEQP